MRKLGIIDANHGQLIGNPQACLIGELQNFRQHNIIACQQRCWRFGQCQQPFQHLGYIFFWCMANIGFVGRKAELFHRFLYPLIRSLRGVMA